LLASSITIEYKPLEKSTEIGEGDLKASLKGQQFLKKNILDENLCTGCGACVGLCPYQVIYHDRTVQLHVCDLDHGRCYDYCPRTPADMKAMRRYFFEADDLTPEIGAVKGYYFSRAADPALRELGQHGATVTALLELSLAEGLMDSAIVSFPDGEFIPQGMLVQLRDEFRKSTRSKFIVSPTVAVFHRQITRETGNVGIVATPCQALALAKMRFKPGNEDMVKVNQLQLVIGLYCGWALSVEKYRNLLRRKNIDPTSVVGMEIPPGKNVLEIFTGNKTESLAMDDVRHCIREACRFCLDSTAEFADVSVGSARFAGDWEEVRRWNQLIVRTARGKELIDRAVKKGVLEIRKAPLENLTELKEAAMKKSKKP